MSYITYFQVEHTGSNRTSEWTISNFLEGEILKYFVTGPSTKEHLLKKAYDFDGTNNHLPFFLSSEENYTQKFYKHLDMKISRQFERCPKHWRRASVI